MTELDAQEELKFIRKIMDETRQAVANDGFDFLRWGILNTIGIFTTYVSILFSWHMNWIWIVWVVLVAIGWTLSVRKWRKYRRARASSFTQRLVGRIWFGCGVALTILGLIGPYSRAYSPMYIVAVLSAVLGAAYYATGMIFGTRWNTVFAIGWWCGSVVMFFHPVVHTLLLFGVMVLAFQVIPGYLFYRSQTRTSEA